MHEGLSTLHRLLRRTDGSVTLLLESFYGETLAAELTSSARQVIAAELLELLPEVASDTSIRSVRLRGRRTHVAYVDATTVLVPGHLPGGVRDGLARTDEPFGSLLRRFEVPVFRKVIDVGADHADGRVMWRRSMIATTHGSAAVVHEAFVLPVPSS